jgi:hypothetical protein
MTGWLMNWHRCERKWLWSNLSQNPRKTQDNQIKVTTASLEAGIWTQDFLYKKQECYLLENDLHDLHVTCIPFHHTTWCILRLKMETASRSGSQLQIAVTNSWQCEVLVLEDSKEGLTPLHSKQSACYRRLHRPQNILHLLNTAL